MSSTPVRPAPPKPTSPASAAILASLARGVGEGGVGVGGEGKGGVVGGGGGGGVGVGGDGERVLYAQVLRHPRVVAQLVPGHYDRTPTLDDAVLLATLELSGSAQHRWVATGGKPITSAVFPPLDVLNAEVGGGGEGGGGGGGRGGGGRGGRGGDGDSRHKDDGLELKQHSLLHLCPWPPSHSSPPALSPRLFVSSGGGTVEEYVHRGAVALRPWVFESSRRMRACAQEWDVLLQKRATTIAHALGATLRDPDPPGAITARGNGVIDNNHDDHHPSHNLTRYIALSDLRSDWRTDFVLFTEEELLSHVCKWTERKKGREEEEGGKGRGVAGRRKGGGGGKEGGDGKSGVGEAGVGETAERIAEISLERSAEQSAEQSASERTLLEGVATFDTTTTKTPPPLATPGSSELAERYACVLPAGGVPLGVRDKAVVGRTGSLSALLVALRAGCASELRLGAWARALGLWEGVGGGGGGGRGGGGVERGEIGGEYLRGACWEHCAQFGALLERATHALHRKGTPVLWDALLRHDAEASCEDPSLFPFEDETFAVLSAFLRDHSVYSATAIPPHSPLVAGLAKNGSIQLAPPCGVLPFERLALLAAPFCLLAATGDAWEGDRGEKLGSGEKKGGVGAVGGGKGAGRGGKTGKKGRTRIKGKKRLWAATPGRAAAYAMFRAFYTRFFCRLGALSTAPTALPWLCTFFLRQAELSAPKAVATMQRLGTPALHWAFPLLRFAFAGGRGGQAEAASGEEGGEGGEGGEEEGDGEEEEEELGASQLQLQPRDLFLLWDRVVGFNSVEPVAVLAVAMLWASAEEVAATTHPHLLPATLAVAGDVTMAARRALSKLNIAAKFKRPLPGPGCHQAGQQGIAALDRALSFSWTTPTPTPTAHAASTEPPFQSALHQDPVGLLIFLYTQYAHK